MRVALPSDTLIFSSSLGRVDFVWILTDFLDVLRIFLNFQAHFRCIFGLPGCHQGSQWSLGFSRHGLRVCEGLSLSQAAPRAKSGDHRQAYLGRIGA